MSDTQKVAVLAGASSGIGAATTRALAADGYRVALLAGGGDIVSISSVARRIARPGNGVYAATRWGLNGWSESLRRELLPDVRVTLIEPGAVATELPTHTTHAETKQGTEALYGQVEVTAEDIAEVIAFAFAVGRPRRLAIHEILLRPAGHEL
jgi:NADP-dependent 3-hydroxy acid dehydrogenase YdfG